MSRLVQVTYDPWRTPFESSSNYPRHGRERDHEPGHDYRPSERNRRRGLKIRKVEIEDMEGKHSLRNADGRRTRYSRVSR